MPHSLVCWRCGASLAALSLPLRRLDVCKACNAELHVCKMCVEYDTSYAKHCKEPTAEEVRKKDEANFCDHFKPKAGAYVAKDTAELARVKSALDDLFKKLIARFPKLAAMQKSTLMAVGVDYQDRGYLLKEGDEVSLFPPVQGG